MPSPQIINPENGSPIQFADTDLPMLIHGTPKAGAALFSVSVIGQLFLSGKKILFLTGYAQAKKEFCEQLKGSERLRDVYELTKSEDLDFASHHGAIILKSRNTELLRQAIEQLPDSTKRIVFIKNAEELLTSELLALLKDRALLVLSGDFDATPLANELLAMPWATQIFFSKPTSTTTIEIPPLKKYLGFMTGKQSGAVGLKK